MRKIHMLEKTQKEDRRTRYTRQVIKEAFLKLLEEKEYPKITVRKSTGEPSISTITILPMCWTIF